MALSHTILSCPFAQSQKAPLLANWNLIVLGLPSRQVPRGSACSIQMVLKSSQSMKPPAANHQSKLPRQGSVMRSEENAILQLVHSPPQHLTANYKPSLSKPQALLSSSGKQVIRRQVICHISMKHNSLVPNATIRSVGWNSFLCGTRPNWLVIMLQHMLCLLLVHHRWRRLLAMLSQVCQSLNGIGSRQALLSQAT